MADQLDTIRFPDVELSTAVGVKINMPWKVKTARAQLYVSNPDEDFHFIQL